LSAYKGLTTQILTQVDDSVRHYTHSTYQALGDVLSPTLNLALVLYVAFYGIGHLLGEIPFDLRRTVRQLLTAAIVTGIVSQWDFFSLYIGNVVTQGPGHLMGVISGVHGDPNAILSDVFERGILAANEINKSAGLSTLGFFIVGYSVFYMTVITVGYALYLIIMAKIALGILLGMAPLFGLFLLFEATREIFTHYLRQLFNFALIPLFTSAVLGIMLVIPQQALQHLQSVLASHSGRGGVECVFVLLSYGVLIGLLHQVTGFAGGISGGGLHLNPGVLPGLAGGLLSGALGRSGRSSSKQLAYWGRRASQQARRLFERSLFKRKDVQP